MAEKGSTTGTQNPTDTPYDLDKIDPTTLAPELVPIYNSMLADYRAKTTLLADSRKESEGRYAGVEEKLGAYQERLKQWEAFGSQVQPIVEQYNSQIANQPSGDADDGLSDYTDDAVNKAVAQQIAALTAKIDEQDKTISNYANQFASVLGMNEQLTKLRGERGDIDPARVFEVAKELGTANLAEASKLAYYDEDREAYAKTYAEEQIGLAKKTWEEERANANIAPGAPGGSIPSANFRTVLEAPGTTALSGRRGWNAARMKMHQALASGQIQPEE